MAEFNLTNSPAVPNPKFYAQVPTVQSPDVPREKTQADVFKYRPRTCHARIRSNNEKYADDLKQQHVYREGQLRAMETTEKKIDQANMTQNLAEVAAAQHAEYNYALNTAANYKRQLDDQRFVKTIYDNEMMAPCMVVQPLPEGSRDPTLLGPAMYKARYFLLTFPR